MRAWGLTLLEIAFALLVLGILAAFVVEPFARALLVGRETEALERAFGEAQALLEGIRANPPPSLEGCASPTPLEEGFSRQLCSYTQGNLIRYEVLLFRGSELQTALASLHLRTTAVINEPPALQQVRFHYAQDRIELVFSEPVRVTAGGLTLTETYRSRFCFIICPPWSPPTTRTLFLPQSPLSGQSIAVNIPLNEDTFPLIGTQYDYTYSLGVPAASVTDIATPPLPLANPGTWTCQANRDPEACQ